MRHELEYTEDRRTLTLHVDRRLTDVPLFFDCKKSADASTHEFPKFAFGLEGVEHVTIDQFHTIIKKARCFVWDEQDYWIPALKLALQAFIALWEIEAVTPEETEPCSQKLLANPKDNFTQKIFNPAKAPIEEKQP